MAMEVSIRVALRSRLTTTRQFCSAARFTVEEDDLATAFSVGNNEDGSVGKSVATGSLTSLVAAGGFSQAASRYSQISVA